MGNNQYLALAATRARIRLRRVFRQDVLADTGIADSGEGGMTQRIKDEENGRDQRDDDRGDDHERKEEGQNAQHSSGDATNRARKLIAQTAVEFLYLCGKAGFFTQDLIDEERSLLLFFSTGWPRADRLCQTCSILYCLRHWMPFVACKGIVFWIIPHQVKRECTGPSL